MNGKSPKNTRPAILFGEKNVKEVGYIDNYIFACEIEGEDHIIYSKPRKPKYHLVIIIVDGYISMVINGEKFLFKKNTYINLPTWADIYEIEYGEGFHAMVTATDRSIVEDIFRNRNPFPPDFKLRIDHGLGGQIMEKSDLDVLCKDIRNLMDSLSNQKHYFAEEINYAYFYILLTDMADMVWRKYGRYEPEHHSEMRRADGILKEFAELLVRNIQTEPEIGFYAEKLCISKQYLSLIVKEKMRVTVGTVISSMRMEIAARLLRDPDLTIQQIAERLSFADQSSFGKFFKKHTGLSPLKYRQNLRKTLLTLRPKEIINSRLMGIS
ncbi:MAG: helix-turn-helix transcriptional regulator [Bacteroidales bacterium]|nr:helix-turn-helix transcriptional regulator [Bacteroidales bacterium]